MTTFMALNSRGWLNERVVVVLPDHKGRILLVLDGDPPAHRGKVFEVARIVERDIDLIDGWIVHDLCKVYMFISKSRVVGILVAEPIKSAYRVRPSSETAESSRISRDSRETDVKHTKTQKSSSILIFGSIIFEREMDNKASSCVTNRNATVETNAGTIICESQAVPACCGIRAIWVVPSRRRHCVATHLLDALRKSFCMGFVLELAQC